MPEQPEPQRKDVEVLPWVISKGDDGVIKDCILIAVMDGADMVSVSLHVSSLPPPD